MNSGFLWDYNLSSCPAAFLLRAAPLFLRRIVDSVEQQRNTTGIIPPGVLLPSLLLESFLFPNPHIDEPCHNARRYLLRLRKLWAVSAQHMGRAYQISAIYWRAWILWFQGTLFPVPSKWGGQIMKSMNYYLVALRYSYYLSR
jgi:hypothetical protein